MKNDVNFTPKKGILKGAEIIYDAVKSTAGASGTNVIIKHGLNDMIVTKDGWTVANEIELHSSLNEEAIGVEAILAASTSANKENGDGSTATVILAYNLLKQSLDSIEPDKRWFDIFPKTKYNVFQVAKGMNDAFSYVEKQLKKKSVKKFDIYDIANISTNNDASLSKVIADAIKMVGKDGSVNIEPSNSKDTYVKKQDGVSIPSGYISHYFINNDKYTAKYSDAALLIVDHDIEDVRDLIHYMKYCSQENMPLIIIANDYNNDVINFLAANRAQKKFPIVAIKSPYYGEKRSLFLEDIANMTGATLIGERQSNYKGLNLVGKQEQRTASAGKNLGRIKSVVVDDEKCIIHYTSLNKEYISSLKAQLENDQNYIRERYNILTSMVANIYVGATTDVELQERMYRAEDALNSVRAALNNGVLKGGGLALLEVSFHDTPENINESEKLGWRVLYDSIRKPSEIIMRNYSDEAYSEYMKNYEFNLQNNIGFDVKDGNLVNFYNRGIIDPTDVVVGSLKHAVSVVSTLLTTAVAVFNDRR